MEVSFHVTTPTWASFESACEVIGVHPDDVLSSDEGAPAVSEETAGALLGVILEDEKPTELSQLSAAHLAWISYLAAAKRHARRATARTKRYAERCAVWDVMRAQAEGSSASLSRVLASFDPSECQSLRHMPLNEMLAFFGMRGVSEISENLSDYL